MYIYVLDHELSNGCMTLTVQGQGLSSVTMHIRKMLYFGRNCCYSWPVHHSWTRKCQYAFFEADIKYIMKTYGGFTRFITSQVKIFCYGLGKWYSGKCVQCQMIKQSMHYWRYGIKCSMYSYIFKDELSDGGMILTIEF